MNLYSIFSFSIISFVEAIANGRIRALIIQELIEPFELNKHQFLYLLLQYLINY